MCGTSSGSGGERFLCPAFSSLARRFSRLDARRLAAAILFVAVFAMAARVPTDTDVWWHLKAGQVTVETGRILQTDLFSHTRYGQPWINHSWLTQVLLYLLFRHGGYLGLGLFQALVATLAMLLVYRQMEGEVFLRGFILLLTVVTAAVIWSVRPQLLSFLLTALLSYLLYLYKWRGVNRLWLIPPLFVLWVNLHAGYALGFILLVGFVAGEALNNLLAWFLQERPEDPILPWRGVGLVTLIGLLSALCLVINPNTTRMWTYYLDTVSIGALQDLIPEWASPDFHPLYTQPFIWMLLGTLALIGLSGRRVDGSDLVLVCGFAYAALLARRNIGPFALVAAPVLSRHARPTVERWLRAARSRDWLPRPRPPRPPTPGLALLNWLLLALAVAAAGVKAYLPLRAEFNVAYERRSLPLEAIEWMRAERPPGLLFNSYNWGGYLIWHLWPDYRVFVDGRTDLYGDAVLDEYLRVWRAESGFQEVFDEYDVNTILIETGGTTDNFLARDGSGWTPVYADEIATIYAREGWEEAR